jgi:hypothetical protein
MRTLAEDLLYNRREDALPRFLAAFEGVELSVKSSASLEDENLSTDERIHIHLGARARHVYLDIARKIAIPDDSLEMPEHPHTLCVYELAFEAVRRRPGQRGRYDRIEQRQIGTPQLQRPSHVLRIARNDRAVEIDRRTARTRVEGQQVRIALAPQSSRPWLRPSNSNASPRNCRDRQSAATKARLRPPAFAKSHGGRREARGSRIADGARSTSIAVTSGHSAAPSTSKCQLAAPSAFFSSNTSGCTSCR